MNELLNEQATICELQEEIQTMERVWETHPTLVVLKSALAHLEKYSEAK